MLTHIYIRDFAIIETLNLELQTGMSALTGETGAGKSILIDAIGLVLGDRADSGVVRHGAKQAEITLSVDISSTVTCSCFFQCGDVAGVNDNSIVTRTCTKYIHTAVAC